ncbi:MAG: FeoA family protein [Oscillospiraceae bacterium]
MLKTVADLKPGQTGVVIKVGGQGAVKRRLIDMGITPGVKVYLRKIAPMGDPMELNLRGYELSLRKQDAARIEIE